MNPKISVVIPVYNGEHFIEKSLECVLKQELAAHEIIVVNDGSTDGTQKILDRYAGKILVKCVPNSGVSAARNLGIRMATGDYVAFLDADDLWFRNKLKVIADVIVRFPDVDVICSDFIVRYPSFGNRLLRHFSVIRSSSGINFNEPLREDPLKLLIRQHVMGAPSAVTVKRTAMQDVVFDERYKFAEDLDFFMRLAIRRRLFFLDTPLLYKHTHEDNASFNKIPVYRGHREVLVNFMREHQKTLAERGLEQECRKKLIDIDYMLGNLHFEEGKVRDAFKLYAFALSQSYSPRNICTFLWTVSKKTARLMTFGLLSRQKIGRLMKKDAKK